MTSASPDAAPLAPDQAARRATYTEVLMLLGVSLGSSAIYSALRIIDLMTRHQGLGAQTSNLNASVTPDRPWLDLAYQLAGIGLGVVPALLAVFLLRHRDAPPGWRLGLDRSHPWRDARQGVALAAVIGIPGLGLYLAGRALGLTTRVSAASLGDHWWSIPVLVLSALQNGVLEEVVVVVYLVTRLRQAGWAVPAVITASAVLRGSYHLYQGFGPFVGNAVMGVVFVLFYLRVRRVAPLVVAHTLLDVVAFVGYSSLHNHVSWL